MSSPPHAIFVASSPGLEPILVRELAEVGLPAEAVDGGVELTGDLDTVYRCNLEVGTGLRVLVRLGSFPARRWGQLVDGVAGLDWGPWVERGGGISIKCKAIKSRLFHSGGIAERVRIGIEGALGGALATGDAGPVTPVLVRLVRDQCVVSVDTTGELLSRRGYRLATGKAPLREDLARALVIASGWDRQSPLVDPMAGAGTIAIEAALLASRRAPGAHRRFAFMDAPGFAESRWQACVAAARERETDAAPPVAASDRDAGVVEMARENAARAGVTIDVAQASLTAAPGLAAPPASGAMVTNPPYGARIRGRDLRPLYQRLGQLVRERVPGWAFAVVVDNPGLAAAMGVPLTSVLMTDHGGRKVYFLRAE